MSPFLNSTVKFMHKSPLPKGATTEATIEMLHDHAYFFSCNPVNDKFELIIKPEPAPTVPEPIKPLVIGETESFKATDILHALPAGLWDSNVVSTYEFTDLSTGVFVRIRSPLNVTIDTVWDVGGEEGALELVEHVSFTCSRLLTSVVRSQCEGGWKEIHAGMIKKLE